ncbi:MAG: hypothetical protein OXU74_06585 [Gemmatimonadota bacterium]|nr:hypothetical protein [Gemmatimonadota bacterium]
MATYYETGVTDNGPLRYRVQLRQRERYVVDQRHIWYPPTPHVSKPTAEDWIPSAGHRIPEHFRKVADPDRALADA